MTEIKDSGATLIQLIAVYPTSALKPLYSAQDFKKIGYDARALRSFGYTAKELAAAGFSLSDLVSAGYPDSEILK